MQQAESASRRHDRPRIAAVSKVLPEHRHTQDEILRALEDYWQDQHYNPQRVRRLFENVEVGSRHLALPLERYPELTDFGQRNDAYIEEATKLGARAIDEALRDAGLTPADVDAIFFTSITGIATPSIDARIVNEMNMRPDVKRTPLFGLGCVGGAAGLARMSDYLRAFDEQVAVLVSVELCSLTLRPEDLSVKNLIASGLFGDGAAAVVAVGARHPLQADGPALAATKSRMYADTEWVMGWDIGADGLGLVLSAELPRLIREKLGEDVDNFLSEQELGRADVDVWVMHTGGPAVLQAVEEALEVPRDALSRTWASLEQVGNLSSASVLFVLADTMESDDTAPDDVGLLLAMGPGFCAEQVLLQW